jgi:predicted ester cyclase
MDRTVRVETYLSIDTLQDLDDKHDNRFGLLRKLTLDYLDEDTETPEFAELSGDVHDRLLMYQRGDESLEETLERVFLAFVPLRFQLDPLGIDPSEVGTKLLVDHAQTKDGHIQKHTYRDGSGYVKRNEEMAKSVFGVLPEQ